MINASIGVVGLRNFKIRCLIWILIAVTFAAGTAGCGEGGVDQTLINTISEIEKSTYELNTLKISYSQYKQRTDKYISEYFTSFFIVGNIIYAEDGFISAISGKEYSEKDWAGMSLDELKKIGEPLVRSLNVNKPGYNYKSCEISKVYDGSKSSTFPQQKYIYVKRAAQTDNLTIPIYKKYTFMEYNKSFVLFAFETVGPIKGKELAHGNERVIFTRNINF